MLILKATGLQKLLGDRTILKNEKLSIYQGDQIGLVGLNGTGKTTLLNILANELKPDRGTVERHGQIAYVQQLNDIKDSMGKTDIYKLDHTQNEKWDTMSGGEKTRRKLAHALSQHPELLLLDEPTNNLDLSGIQLLEKELANYQGALIIVSHDRKLLDHVCRKIWELDNGVLNEYNGNYTSFLEQKEAKRQRQFFEYEQYTKEKKRLLEANRRKQQQAQGMNKPPSRMSNSEWQLYKGAKDMKKGRVMREAKVIKTRIDQLEKVEKPFERPDLEMKQFFQSPMHSRFAMRVEKLSKGFADRTLYEKVSFEILTGEKVVLLGDNGSGKTTLIKQLFDDREHVWISKGAKIGSLTQEQEDLPQSKTILQYVMADTTLQEHQVRMILARLCFREENVHKTISNLSGGERVKVAFAKLFVGDYNLLVLDEPTNHLDTEAMEALEEMLIKYPGTLLFVSHDRMFVDKIATKILTLKDKTITEFRGTYTEYQSVKKKTFREDKIRQQLMIVENRLTEVIGKLSLADPDDVELNKEFDELIQEKNKLKKLL